MIAFLRACSASSVSSVDWQLSRYGKIPSFHSIWVNFYPYFSLGLEKGSLPVRRTAFCPLLLLMWHLAYNSTCHEPKSSNSYSSVATRARLRGEREIFVDRTLPGMSYSLISFRFNGIAYSFCFKHEWPVVLDSLQVFRVRRRFWLLLNSPIFWELVVVHSLREREKLEIV